MGDKWWPELIKSNNRRLHSYLDLMFCQCGVAKNEIEIFACEQCGESCCNDCLLDCMECRQAVCIKCRDKDFLNCCKSCAVKVIKEYDLIREPSDKAVYLMVEGRPYRIRDNETVDLLLELTEVRNRSKLRCIDIKGLGILKFSHRIIYNSDHEYYIYCEQII